MCANPSQLQLNYDEAREARDRGMQAATDNADRQIPTWSDRALAFLHSYAIAKPDLTTEAVRIYAHNLGLATPPDGRAWGTVTRRAARLGWIAKSGRTATAVDPKVHCNEVRVWQSLIYAGRE